MPSMHSNERSGAQLPSPRIQKMKTSLLSFAPILAFLLATLPAQAAPPFVTYAGQVASGGQPFNGTGQFKFAFVNADANVTYWSQDGTSSAGSEPTAFISVPVNGGYYSILLGNTAITGMGAIDPTIFKTYSDVHLRVWFSDGVAAFEELSPHRPFASVPYALNAGNAQIAPGSITSEMLAPGVLPPGNQTQGQVVSVASGSSPPAGYSKVLDDKITWKVESTDGPYRVSGGGWGGKLLSVNNVLYCLSGQSSSMHLGYYDENASRWKSVTNPSPPNNHGTNGGNTRDRGWGGSMGNKIYVVGGQGFNNDSIVSVYDTLTGNWQSGPSLPQYSSEFPPYVESVGTRLFVFSFVDASTTKAFELDANGSSWTEITVDRIWAHSGASLTLGNSIYFIGGDGGYNSPSSMLQKFDSSTGVLSNSSLPAAILQPSAFSINGFIYVIGKVGQFYRYDPDKNTWDMVHAHPFPPDSTYVNNHTAGIHKSKAWVTGGTRFRANDGNGGSGRDTETYTGTFSPALYSYSGGSSSNGGSPSNGSGFGNPSLSSLFMPYGYDGEPVIGGSTYTVPDGKVLITSNYHGYIKIGTNSVNSFSRDSSAASDVVILPEKTTFTLTYNSSSTGSGFVGMLFDQSDDFEAVYGGASYTVPLGKKLHVTSAVGMMRINGNAVSFRPTIGRIPMLLPSQTTFSLDTGPAQMNYGFSGYLVDENKTLGGGIYTSDDSSSSGTTGSVTKSMLSDTILKYLKPEITQQPTLNTIYQGETISLSGKTEGKYLTYQWKRNGVSLNGETNSTLTIADANASQHDGNYTLVVANDFGSLETNSIPVLVQVRASTHIVDLNSSINLEMIWVSPGTFIMGSPISEANRDPAETEHNVTLTKGFYLGKYEVTQAQYAAVMTGNAQGLSPTPSQYSGNPNRPVELVSWDDVQIFLSRLNAAEQAAGRLPSGWSYVLPTEAEWEYACRAGTNTVYSWGATIAPSNANYSSSGFGQTRDVGQYAANPWGFFDMHGNVYEWVADRYGTYPAVPVTDPTGSALGSDRVYRGSSWSNDAMHLRAAKRDNSAPSSRSHYVGFRLGFKAN